MEAGSEAALRARLIELSGAVRGYFEGTGTNRAAGAGLFAAFDALRRNRPLAEAFVADLEALLSFLEQELVPALSGAAPRPVAAGRAIKDDETMLLNRLPASVQKEVARFQGATSTGADRRSAPPVEEPVTEQEIGEEDEVTPPPRPAARSGPGPSQGSPRPPPPPPASRSTAARSGPAPATPPPAPAPKSGAAPVRAPVQGSLAARIAAVTAADKAAPGPGKPAPRPMPGVKPDQKDQKDQKADAAARPGRPQAPPPQGGAARVGKPPVFDESDLTSPGFSMDDIPEPKADK